MTLIELAPRLEQFLRASIIYAARENGTWISESDATVMQLSEYEDDEDVVAPVGQEYFLEVFLALEAIEAYAHHSKRALQSLSDEERCNAMIYYAQHDTYLPV